MAFIHDDFLLETPLARELYHEHAEPQPIIDYHCHLPPDEIAEDRRFENIAQIWLKGDHYKWRAMRANGVPERYCTGDASDREKFEQWAATVPRCLRNPLYHWTHLELARPFGITDRLLGPATAESIWQDCNARLAEPSFSTRGLLRQWRVEVVCTTDDPADDLAQHLALKDSDCHTLVLPTWRPDKAMAVDDVESYNAYLDRLGAAADVDITDLGSFWVAIRKRHDFFHEVGCRLSDHGLEQCYAAVYNEKEVAAAFDKLRGGNGLDRDEALKLKSALLEDFGKLDHEKGWTQQFHLGAMRNNNTRLFQQLGPDTGFDSIGDFPQGRALSRFLDRLDRSDQLTRTILYNLNANDNDLFATMIGNFQDGSTPGKMQYGSAWWFHDQWDGMSKQIESLSNMGLLARFVGMLTDSRSFLSYSRHEYFRRLLCNIIGNDVARGALPDERELLAGLVEDVCYRNAREYFRFHEVREGARVSG